MTLLVALLIAAADLLAPGRQAVHNLDYETAVRELSPVADDEAAGDDVRARAYMLLAEARFGMAHVDAEARAKNAFRAALALEPRIDFENRDDVSPRLVAIFEALRSPIVKEPALPVRSSSPTATEPTATEPTASEPTPTQPHAGMSPWWFASAGLATTALLAGGAALGIDAYLGDLPPLMTAEEVGAVRASGVAVTFIAIGAGVAALATSAVAMAEP